MPLSRRCTQLFCCSLSLPVTAASSGQMLAGMELHLSKDKRRDCHTRTTPRWLCWVEGRWEFAGTRVGAMLLPSVGPFRGTEMGLGLMRSQWVYGVSFQLEIGSADLCSCGRCPAEQGAAVCVSNHCTKLLLAQVWFLKRTASVQRNSGKLGNTAVN